jgi:hypothetical protein
LPAVQIRQRVCFGAGLQQGFCNIHRVGGSFLSVSFNAVGGNVMQQGGAVHRRIEMRDPRRARSNQFRILVQQGLERGQVAGDDRFHGRFKRKDWRIFPRDRFDVLRQRCPMLKVVPARDGELRIGKIERRVLNFGVGNISRQPENFRIQETGMIFVEDADGLGIARLMRSEQFGGLLPIRLEAGGKG